MCLPRITIYKVVLHDIRYIVPSNLKTDMRKCFGMDQLNWKISLSIYRNSMDYSFNDHINHIIYTVD